MAGVSEGCLEVMEGNISQEPVTKYQMVHGPEVTLGILEGQKAHIHNGYHRENQADYYHNESLQCNRIMHQFTFKMTYFINIYITRVSTSSG